MKFLAILVLVILFAVMLFVFGLAWAARDVIEEDNRDHR